MKCRINDLAFVAALITRLGHAKNMTMQRLPNLANAAKFPTTKEILVKRFAWSFDRVARIIIYFNILSKHNYNQTSKLLYVNLQCRCLFACRLLKLALDYTPSFVHKYFESGVGLLLRFS